MFRYYDSKPDVPLHDPYVIRDFCEKNSPGLFDLLVKAITRSDNRQSSQRESLQRERKVSLLDILSYFRLDPNTFAWKHDNFWLKKMSMSACIIIFIFTDILGQEPVPANLYTVY